MVDWGRPDGVVYRGAWVPLRPMEYRLLARLAAEAGRTVSRFRLEAALDCQSGEAVYTHVSRLRAALGPVVRTVRPFGVRLDLSPAAVTLEGSEEAYRPVVTDC